MLCRAFHLVGAVRIRCRKCPTTVSFVTDGAEPFAERGAEARCSRCNRLLAEIRLSAGSVEFVCTRCKHFNTISAVPPRPAPSVSTAEMVATMEQRWALFPFLRARQSAELAAGLRFTVLRRDGFRCRYCGRSPDDGAMLHVDHVLARSRGGPTTLENLVTACQECNLGKSDRDLEGTTPAI